MGRPRVPRPGRPALREVFTASVWKEGQWYVAQALEADVTSQGESVDEALANLREAQKLHLKPARSLVCARSSQSTT